MCTVPLFCLLAAYTLPRPVELSLALQRCRLRSCLQCGLTFCTHAACPCPPPAGAAGADDQREAAADQRVRERQGDTQPAGAGGRGQRKCAVGRLSEVLRQHCCVSRSVDLCVGAWMHALLSYLLRQPPMPLRPCGAQQPAGRAAARTALSSPTTAVLLVPACRSCPRCPACWASPSKRTPARSEAAGAGRGGGRPTHLGCAARLRRSFCPARAFDFLRVAPCSDCSLLSALVPPPWLAAMHACRRRSTLRAAPVM